MAKTITIGDSPTYADLERVKATYADGYPLAFVCTPTWEYIRNKFQTAQRFVDFRIGETRALIWGKTLLLPSDDAVVGVVHFLPLPFSVVLAPKCGTCGRDLL